MRSSKAPGAVVTEASVEQKDTDNILQFCANVFVHMCVICMCVCVFFYVYVMFCLVLYQCLCMQHIDDKWKGIHIMCISLRACNMHMFVRECIYRIF